MNAVWCIGGLLPAVYSLFVIDISDWFVGQGRVSLIRAFDRDVSLNCWTPSACESNEHFAVIRVILTCREIKLVHSESCSFFLSFSSYAAGMQPVCRIMFLVSGSCRDHGSIRQPVLLVRVSLYALPDVSSIFQAVCFARSHFLNLSHAFSFDST